MTDGDTGANVTQVYMLGKTHLANGQGQFFIKNDPIVYMAVGDQHTIVLTKTGRAFAFGDNTSGQLGLGHTNPVDKVSCIKSLKFSSGAEKVILAACGTQSSIVATDRGNLYAFGSNSNSQLGFDSGPIQSTPKKIESLTHYEWKQLAMGAEHTCALTVEGEVFIWGSNEDGQCGQSATHKIFDSPKELRLEQTIAWVACGNYHTAVVDTQGKLFLFGNNDDRQLGVTKSADFDPQEVKMKFKAKQVACGNQHTVVLTVDGQVYACGNNSRGQLGLGESVKSVNTFELVENAPKKITSIAAGEGHTALINEHGSVYLFGDGKHGKLGVATHTNEFEPYRVDRFKGYEALKVACGGCHTIVLARKRSKDEIEHSESEEDSGAATLSVTQKPKSQARVNRTKSMAERSQNVSGSMNATMKAGRAEETSNHLRVEPAPDSDNEHTDNELTASMKSFTFNQTHATLNGKFRPTQDLTSTRTNNARTIGEELRPLRTGVLDRTNRLNPETEVSARSSATSPQPQKSSEKAKKVPVYNSDDSEEDFRSQQVPKKSPQLAKPLPKKVTEQPKGNSSSDSENEKPRATASKEPGQKEFSSKLHQNNKSSDKSSDNSRTPSPRPKPRIPVSSTQRSSDDSDEDIRNPSRKTNMNEPAKLLRVGNTPPVIQRRSTTSESEKEERTQIKPVKPNETPRTNRSIQRNDASQRGREVEESIPSSRRPLPSLKTSSRKTDETESDSDDDDTEDENDRSRQSPVSPRKGTTKAPDPAPRHGTVPPSSNPKENETADPKSKGNGKEDAKSSESSQPGFFARLFGGRSTPPEKSQDPNAKPPPTDNAKDSRACSVM